MELMAGTPVHAHGILEHFRVVCSVSGLSRSRYPVPSRNIRAVPLVYSGDPGTNAEDRVAGGIMLLAVAGLTMTLLTGTVADVTGRWEGKISGTRPDGSAHEDTALLILTQKGSTVTGTVGGNDNDQHPIVSATVEGTTLKIAAKHATNGREYEIVLTLSGDDEMKGKIIAGGREAGIAVTRQKR